ncbi:hypothetical protein ACIBF5_17705 [Micromonospora sp. NPDC050417]|uniref:hypothetical protein n=1 Tax=Micromonospora sp. NPDC050417 TaxID=3364280 RepID=UPI003798DB59
MRGGMGTVLLMVLLSGALFGLGGALLVVPGRTTRLLNDAFFVVPRVGGRYQPVKRVVAMLVGLALIGYAAFLVYDFVLATVLVYDPVPRA